MSTGTLACATLSQSESLPFLAIPAQGLCWLNFLIFLFMTPYALYGWIRYPSSLGCACADTGQAAFLSTSGIALLVLANQCLFFGLGTVPAFLFWTGGTIVTFCLNFRFLFRLFSGKHELKQITPALFIPVVGLVVIPAGGSALFTGLESEFSELIRLVCVLALGAGLLLYGGLFASLLQRHVLLEPIPDALAPTLWIHLAPLGWGAISIISLGHITLTAQAQEILNFFGLLAWGAAAWWVLMAALLTTKALKKGASQFGLAWWAFIFPLGSFTLLTKLLRISYAGGISFAVWLLMLVIWGIAVWNSIRMAINGCKCQIAQRKQ